MTYHSDWGKVSRKEKVSSSLDCLRMLVMKHFNTCNVRPQNILELLTPKSKLNGNRCYMHCVKRYLHCTNWWLRQCFDSSCTWIKASKALAVSVSIFRGRILWRFSLSKNNISPAASDLELILFPLWYWPVMNAHTKQQHKATTRQSVWNKFYWQSKTWPPHVHTFWH